MRRLQSAKRQKRRMPGRMRLKRGKLASNKERLCKEMIGRKQTERVWSVGNLKNANESYHATGSKSVFSKSFPRIQSSKFRKIRSAQSTRKHDRFPKISQSCISNCTIVGAPNRACRVAVAHSFPRNKSHSPFHVTKPLWIDTH